MDYQYINSGSIKLAYIETNKNARHTIFFIHGNSISKRSWRKQYNSENLSAYRMVAIDLPAHGDSDAAPNNYTLPGLAKIMYETVKVLAYGKPYILAGISLSTNIIAEMLAHNLEPAGLVLAAPSIVGENISIEKFVKRGTHVSVVFTDVPDAEDLLAYAKEASLSADENDHAVFIEDYYKVKLPFRSLLAQSVATSIYSDQIALLQNKKLPVLMIFGKEEQIVDPDYLDYTNLPLWNNKIYKIEGAGHLVNIDQAESFNLLLKEFADESFK